jgi:isoleucyl-tRNA synthetase
MLHDKPERRIKKTKLHVLDKWILSRINTVVLKVTASLEEYDAFKATKSIENFIQDFSTWYIRRSRDRIGPSANDDYSKKAFYDTSIKTLITLCKILAPFIPFLADFIYLDLTEKKSIHLEDWPEVDKSVLNAKLENQMHLSSSSSRKIS